jgi:hypothetical protein
MARSAGFAVLEAAAKLGIRLPLGAEETLATAALTYADNVYGITQLARREEWADTRWRERLRRRMQHQLLEELITRELLMVTLPQEAVTYHVESFTGPGAALPEGAPWDMAKVQLRVQVRNARDVA